MAQVDWRPGTPERRRRARAALAGGLEEGGGPLTFEGGWRAGAPVSQGELWAMIVSLAADASRSVAHFSEASRYPEVRLPETVNRRAQDAGVIVWRPAAAILIELRTPRPRQVLAAGRTAS